MRLFLVRHGQTEWNAHGRAQGHTDIELDNDGLAQARQLTRAFHEIPINRIVSSDLKRCAVTAQHISTGVEIEYTPLLRERGFGEWEGLDFEHINEQMRLVVLEGIDPFHVRPPGGESFEDVWLRIETIVDDVRHYNGNVAVVSHGATCALLLAKLLRGSLETSRSFRFGNTAVTELERRPDGLFLMLRYNDTSHLREPVLAGDMDGSRK